MHTIVRIGIGIALLAAGALGATARPASAVVVAPGVRVSAERPEQVALSRWAAGRFEAAGLAVPGVEIRFHADRAGCGGHLGYARAGTVDVCTTTVNTMTRRTLLHEMSHIWLDEHTDLHTRERFLEFRRLRGWNASTDPWQLRGYEQGAETIAWAIGERILSAQIPDNDPPTLEAGFQILTGIAAPRVEGWTKAPSSGVGVRRPPRVVVARVVPRDAVACFPRREPMICGPGGCVAVDALVFPRESGDAGARTHGPAAHRGLLLPVYA